jgi:hypothetical protein
VSTIILLVASINLLLGYVLAVALGAVPSAHAAPPADASPPADQPPTA